LIRLSESECAGLTASTQYASYRVSLATYRQLLYPVSPWRLIQPLREENLNAIISPGNRHVLYVKFPLFLRLLEREREGWWHAIEV